MESKSTTCIYQQYWEMISILFWGGQVIQILFLTEQKQRCWSYWLHKCLNITKLKKKFNVICISITLEIVSEWKLLSITLNEHFLLDKHISKLSKDCCSSLSVVKKLKRYTTLPVRKELTESLMFSRLDYCNNFFIDLPQRQIKRLLKLQKTCAGFVLNQ